jgi:hypothetical protein
MRDAEGEGRRGRHGEDKGGGKREGAEGEAVKVRAGELERVGWRG